MLDSLKKINKLKKTTQLKFTQQINQRRKNKINETLCSKFIMRVKTNT